MNTNTFYSKSHSSLGRAIAQINSSARNDTRTVITLPPDCVDEQTDEEELDDDNLASENIPLDVAGSVEIEYERDDDEDDDDEDDDDEYESLLRPLPKRKRSSQTELKWKKITPCSNITRTEGAKERKAEVVETFSNQNPVKIFESIFDDSVLELILSQTMLFAQQKNDHKFTISKDELKMFFGILYLSGYNSLARERLYWSLDEDVGVKCVSSCMPRNRFQEIKKYLHFADNSSIDKSDRMYKLRPLMVLLNSKFRQWGIFHEDLSIDEAMVKYFGRHPTKQFIRGKPIRFGYKNWTLCSSNGYCYAFDTYCGAQQQTPVGSEKMPLGSKVVLQLLSNVPHPSDHTLFCDNFFTSYDLLVNLQRKGFGMGGVDLLDQATNNYRITIRGKKWWWVLFTHMLNVTMVNAWNIHRTATAEPMDLLSFVRNVTRSYLCLSRKGNRQSYDRTRKPGSVPESVVSDPEGHFPMKLEKQQRCAVCHARVRWSCKKCLKTLCMERDCFERFHTRK